MSDLQLGEPIQALPELNRSSLQKSKRRPKLWYGPI
jgi:hypothetical protein